MPATVTCEVAVSAQGGAPVAAWRSRPWAAPTDRGGAQCFAGSRPGCDETFFRVGAGHARDRGVSGCRIGGV